jgi:hypothetical protein
VADYNSDGHSDIVWHHIVTGQNAIWMIRNFAMASVAGTNSLPDARFRGAGPR